MTDDTHTDHYIPSITLDLEPLAASISRMNEAVLRVALASAIAEQRLQQYATAYFGSGALPSIIEMLMRRRDRTVRHLLGYDQGELRHPRWVRRVHDEHVRQFGSGNGRVDE